MDILRVLISYKINILYNFIEQDSVRCSTQLSSWSVFLWDRGNRAKLWSSTIYVTPNLCTNQASFLCNLKACIFPIFQCVSVEEWSTYTLHALCYWLMQLSALCIRDIYRGNCSKILWFFCTGNPVYLT